MSDHSWNRNRDKIIMALGRAVQLRGDDSRKTKIVQGVLALLKGDKEAQAKYDVAVAAGATKVLVPWEIWCTGYFNIQCCGECDGSYGQYSVPDRVELEIFDWHVWTCPRCGMVWALRTEVPEEDEDDIS